MKEKELLRLTELKKIEQEIYDQGKEYICGIDEAGRGPLAGPVDRRSKWFKKSFWKEKRNVIWQNYRRSYKL